MKGATFNSVFCKTLWIMITSDRRWLPNVYIIRPNFGITRDFPFPPG